MQRVFLFLFFVLTVQILGAHSGKARFHVLIDTDGAADDLRAICMLLGSPDVEVLAITTTEGALDPAEASVKVTSLLRHFYHEGIPVGVGRGLPVDPPRWRTQSEQVAWGDAVQTGTSLKTAKELIAEMLAGEEEKVIMVCLGALANINDALENHPELKNRIERVLWYNDRLETGQGANYQADTASAKAILESGLKLEIISEGAVPVSIDRQYLDSIERIDNSYARKIADTHRKGVLAPVVTSGHLKAWDDLAVVWLLAPELFTPVSVTSSVSVCVPDDGFTPEQMKNVMAEILVGKPDGENRVFARFPEEERFYAGDVVPFIGDIVERHGKKEWRAGVLTNELHGHLGIYAIVGVKMGIRAREYFNIGVDDMEVVSFAGSRPPVSCMNDGLQVSTGGTLGHGLISVSPEGKVRPEATFQFKNRGVTISLKREYASQIQADVKEAIRLYGNLTELYWQRIRELAIRYWLTFDRHEMFELNELQL